MNIDSLSTNSSAIDSYTAYGKSAATDKSQTKSDINYGKDAAVVYEKSDNTNALSNKALVEKLKADAQNRIDNMQNLVKNIFEQQGKSFNTADEMWKMLAGGDFTVDAKTAQEAKDSISEDGYWGVNQTSQRIFDFAVALSGGDDDKMNDMLNAFKKGFSAATKSWGKELPDICSQTYDSVLKKFEDYNSKNTTADSE